MAECDPPAISLATIPTSTTLTQLHQDVLWRDAAGPTYHGDGRHHVKQEIKDKKSYVAQLGHQSAACNNSFDEDKLYELFSKADKINDAQTSEFQQLESV